MCQSHMNSEGDEKNVTERPTKCTKKKMWFCCVISYQFWPDIKKKEMLLLWLFLTCWKRYSTSVLYKLIELPPWSNTNVLSSPIFGMDFNALHTRKRLSRNIDKGTECVPGPISIVAIFAVVVVVIFPTFFINFSVNPLSIFKLDWNFAKRTLQKIKRKKNCKL